MAQTKPITYQGKTQSLTDWSKELNISRHTLSKRLNKHGWDIEKAFSTEVGEAVQPHTEATRLAREMKADFMADIKTFHEAYGARALMDQMKKELDEGRAVKLYKEVIIPLFPKDEVSEQMESNNTAVNIINHIDLKDLNRFKPL